MESSSIILIYAELLANIKRVSVGVSLTSPTDTSTKAEITHHGRRLQVHHQGHWEALELPAQVAVSAELAALPLPAQGSMEFSWRLPVSPHAGTDSHFSPENQAIPWTSVDIKSESPISCRKCAKAIIADGRIKVWKDLPSENWAEMMEFWHCHKPHDHAHQDPESLSSKGYGANSAICAQSGVGLVDLASFLFAEADCDGLTYSLSTIEAGVKTSTLALENSEEFPKLLHVFCTDCRTELGLYSILKSSVTLFKWQVSCETVSLTTSPSSSECLVAMLVASISRSGSSKSVIFPHRFDSTSKGPGRNEETGQVLYLWVLNQNVNYSSSSSKGSKKALKILYRKIDTEKGNEMIEALNSDAQEITLPLAAIETTENLLETSNLLLPNQERRFKDWRVGLIERWSPVSR